MPKEEIFDTYSIEDETNLAAIWCPKCNKMLTNEYKRCPKCGKIFDDRWIAAFEQITMLEKKEKMQYESQQYKEAINTATQIIEIAKKVGDKFIERTQIEFIADARGKMEALQKRTEITSKAKQLSEVYDQLVSKSKNVDAHNSVARFKKEYAEFGKLLQSILEVQALFSKDDKVWNDFLEEQKRIAAQLNILEKQITAKAGEKDFKGADEIWVNAKELIAKINDEGLKQKWYDFEREYQKKKKVFEEDTELTKKANAAMEEASNLAVRFAFDDAITVLTSIINLISHRDLPEVNSELQVKRKDILGLQKDYNNRSEHLTELENQVRDYQDKYLLLKVIQTCDEILGLSSLLGKDVITQKYQSLKEDTQKKLDKAQDDINLLTEKYDGLVAGHDILEGHNLVLDFKQENQKILDNPTFPAFAAFLTKEIETWTKYQEELASIAGELTQIRGNIEKSAGLCDYTTADANWVKAKDLLTRIIDADLKESWVQFEQEYLDKKRAFEEAQQELFKNLDQLETGINQDAGECDFAAADVKWANAKEILPKVYNGALKSKWDNFETKYEQKKKSFEEEQRQLTSQLNRLEQNISEDVKNNSFSNADAKWIQAKELIPKSFDAPLKQHWADSEQTYLKQKAHFELIQDLIGKANNALEKSTEMAKVFTFDPADALLNDTIAIVKRENLSEQVLQLTQKKEEIAKFQLAYKEALGRLSIYEQKFNENNSNKMLNTALNYCNKILDLAPQVEQMELVTKYSQLREEIQRDLEALAHAKKKEIDDLAARAKELESMIQVEKDVLPLVEDFAASDLLGTLSDDVNSMLGQLTGLLGEHRVAVKNEVSNALQMTSTTGEMVEVNKVSAVQETKKETQGTPSEPLQYAYQSGFSNPFPDSIEAAVITDLIPYNYEITEVYLNGKEIDKIPEKALTKDGLELKWNFGNIPADEKVDIQYDLRKRVSRTIILIHKGELKIVKTHTKMKQRDVEGLYEARLPFTNPYDEPLEGIVIEDIIPLYYVYMIEEPRERQPALTSLAQLGAFVKWELDRLESGVQPYLYKLIEIFRYEELKMQFSKMAKQSKEDLDAGNIKSVLKTQRDIITKIEEYLK